jgi:hypothetical protein
LVPHTHRKVQSSSCAGGGGGGGGDDVVVVFVIFVDDSTVATTVVGSPSTTSTTSTSFGFTSDVIVELGKHQTNKSHYLLSSNMDFGSFVSRVLFPPVLPVTAHAGPPPGGSGKAKHPLKAILSGGIAGGIEICITYPTGEQY